MRSPDMTPLPMVHAYVPMATYSKDPVGDEHVNDHHIESRQPMGSRESVVSLGCVYPRREGVVGQHTLADAGHGDMLVGRVNGSVTTAEQVAWEYRAARDALEMASNMSGYSSRFEVESNCSDRAETMSTISTVSGYEEEMFRIKRLLLMDTDATPPQKHRRMQKEFLSDNKRHSYPKNVVNGNSFDSMGKTENNVVEIAYLKSQLQDTVLEKEKYKEALESSTKASLEWQGKYQESLRQKAHVEGRLESLKTEFEFLQQKVGSIESENKSRRAVEGKIVFQEMEKMTCEHARIQQLSRDVQNKNHELSLQLELKDTALTHAKNELQEFESTNEKLRIQLHELQVELDSKDGAIQGLKAKIASLHVESQAHLQANAKANNTIVRMKGEIESLTKSSQWYCDQLHACQEAKVKVQQELMTFQSNHMSQSHLVEKLKNEVFDLQRTCGETRNRAVKEKESLMRKLEVIQADILEREAMILSQIQHGEASDTLATLAIKLKKIEEEKHGCNSNLDFTVEDLKQEILLLEKDLSSKNNKLETLESNNADLMIRITTIQKTLNERELYLQNLQNNHRTLEIALSKERENMKEKNNLNHELLTEKIDLEVALTTERKEKKEVDEAIEKLRTDFCNVSRNFQAMKADLRLKENHISNLEKLLKELQADRQNLAIKNETLPVVEKKAADLAVKQKSLEETVMKLMETVSIQEQQLVAQGKTIELHKSDLQKKEAMVAVLESEKWQLEESLRKEKTASQAMSDHLFQYGSPLKMMKELELARRLNEEYSESRKNMRKELKDSSSQTENVLIESKCLSYKPQLCHESSVNDQCVSELLSRKNNSKKIVDLCDNFEQLCSLVTETKSIVGNSLGRHTKKSDLSGNKLENVQSLCSTISVINNDLKKLLIIDGVLSSVNKSNEPYNVVVKDSTTSESLVAQEEDVSQSSFPQVRTVGMASVANQSSNEEVGTQAYRREVERLKAMMRLLETEHKEKHRRYELNVRTLLKEVKEHMRGRRAAEKHVKELTAGSADMKELRARVKVLEGEVEGSGTKCREQVQALEKLQLELLEAEKLRGRLEEAASKRAVLAAPEEDTAVTEQLELRARELQLQCSQEKVAELEEELRKSKIIIKELRKEVRFYLL
ncbi:hypothetical protein PR048_026556 [Dryococelus australis]|uniref:Uncharacterized protein n=1 Tax=Dryococelus australis TaxID=614101 RepID=A0ABQ9GLN9_9NEOP|nr:hypothetical protein PR048_026556 [Dryococelus australis]